MKTDEVEKVLKKKFQHGKSLQEQCTPEQWAEICFKSELEIEIATQKGMTNRTETEEQIEARVKERYKNILDSHGGDYTKAIAQLG